MPQPNIRVNELNPLINPREYMDIPRRNMDWHELKPTDKIECERLRFVTDANFPMLDCTYFHAIVNGERVSITDHPFWQIPKRTWKTYLIKICKRDKLFVRYIIDNTSVLW